MGNNVYLWRENGLLDLWTPCGTAELLLHRPEKHLFLRFSYREHG